MEQVIVVRLRSYVIYCLIIRFMIYYCRLNSIEGSENESKNLLDLCQ